MVQAGLCWCWIFGGGDREIFLGSIFWRETPPSLAGDCLTRLTAVNFAGDRLTRLSYYLVLHVADVIGGRRLTRLNELHVAVKLAGDCLTRLHPFDAVIWRETANLHLHTTSSEIERLQPSTPQHQHLTPTHEQLHDHDHEHLDHRHRRHRRQVRR